MSSGIMQWFAIYFLSFQQTLNLSPKSRRLSPSPSSTRARARELHEHLAGVDTNWPLMAVIDALFIRCL